MKGVSTFAEYLRRHAHNAILHEDGFKAESALHPGGLWVTPHAQNKPWGGEVWWVYCAQYAMKTLFVKAGARLSYQHHETKEESWRFITPGWAIIEDEEYEFAAGAVVHLKPGTKHRLIAKDHPVIVEEVSSPQLMDVVRHSDDFSRTTPTAG